MSTLNTIGLDAKKSEELSNKLNDLLANYTLFYQNVRGYHWNVKGEKFDKVEKTKSGMKVICCMCMLFL